MKKRKPLAIISSGPIENKEAILPSNITTFSLQKPKLSGFWGWKKERKKVIVRKFLFDPHLVKRG
jgi:hypothetical protein